MFNLYGMLNIDEFVTGFIVFTDVPCGADNSPGYFSNFSIFKFGWK